LAQVLFAFNLEELLEVQEGIEGGHKGGMNGIAFF
jgi:hypothetical protein